MRGLQNATIGAPAMVVRVYPYTPQWTLKHEVESGSIGPTKALDSTRRV